MSGTSSPFAGVSRREFLTFCGGIAALIGAGEVGIPEVASALEQVAKRPVVVWSTFQACTGCAVSLLQSRTPEVANLILKQISLDYQDNVMAAAGEAAEKSFNDAIAGDFFWVVEGAIPIKIPEASSAAGKTALDLTKQVYPKAKATIAMGSCACYGNIPAAKPNPTGAVGVVDALKASGTPNPVVVNLSRCPGNGEDLIAVVTHVLVTGKAPELDAVGRPKFLYGQTIHDSCFRRGHFEAGEFATAYGDPNIGEGWCLFKLGCKGPVTYAPCGITMWNGHVSWCLHNAPCTGCSEPGFWDKLTPFSEQLAGLGGFPVDTVGEGLGIAAAVGLGAHLIGQTVSGRLGHGGPPEESEGGEA